MTSVAMDPDLLVDADWHVTGEPYALWRWMRENAPVHRHPATDLPPFWSVTRHADVRAVYADITTFSSTRGVLLRAAEYGDDPGGGLTLALTDPPRHRQVRALIADQFTPRCARAISNDLRADVRSALARAADQGECDFAHDVAVRLSTLLICRLMGIPMEHFETLFQWTTEAFAAGKPLAAHLSTMQYLIDLIYSRVNTPTNDIASWLTYGLIDGEELSETEILLNFENLIGATENATLSMAGGVYAMV